VRFTPAKEFGVRWLSLFFWIGLCFAVAAAGSRWTAAAIPGWYRGLAKPWFVPPNWVFAPVWTLLYLLMAIAAWRISLAGPSAARTVCIALFLLQLGLNLLWSFVFFGRHAIGAGLVEIVALWAAIAASTLAFARIDPVAAWLMAPYWAWVSFAALLNAGIWRLN
jgi:tryptophan-rich sensory protein